MNTVGGEKVVPLINLLIEEVLAAPFILMDETYLQVLKSDKAVGSDHYIVVRAAGPPGRRVILYDYLASRTTQGLKRLLIGPEGPHGPLLRVPTHRRARCRTRRKARYRLWRAHP